jgi:triacylglycerol lipase
MRQIKQYLNYILSPIKGFSTLLLCIILFPSGLFSINRIRQISASKTPILLIHGYLYNKGGWLFLRKRLLNACLGPVFTINLGYPFRSIEEYSQLIKAKAEQIAQITGRNDLILIGHSMGGIISSYYAAYLAPPGTVKHVITLGSPLKGTKMSIIGIGKCIRQIAFDNIFILQLQKDVSKLNQTQFLCIGSQTDLFIIPQESALYSHPEAKKLVFPDMGHLQFLFSRRVADAIIAQLQDLNAKTQRHKDAK